MALVTRRGLLAGTAGLGIRRKRRQRMAMYPDVVGDQFFVVITSGGAGSGVFVYSPSFAVGNLVASMTASTTGPLGETVKPGITTYQEVGGVQGLTTQLTSGIINFLDQLSPDTVTHNSSAGILHQTSAGQSPVTFIDSPSTDAGGLHASIWLIGKPTGAGNGRVLLWNGVDNVNFQAMVAGVLQFCTVAAGVATAVNIMRLGPSNEFQVDHALLVDLAGAGNAVEIQLSADTNFRALIDSNGKVIWGSGAAVGDVALSRDSAGQLAITDAGGGGTIAALRIQAHSQPTTPGSGATIWATGGVMHHLNSAGLDGALPAVQTDGTTFTVIAAVATQASKAWSIPAGDANAGTCYRLTVWAFGTEGSTAQNLQFGIALNGVQIRSAQAAALTLNGAFRMKCQIILHVKTTGAGGTADVTGNMDWATTATPAVEGTVVAGSLAAGGEAFNTTIANTIQLDLNWASATGAPTITTMGSIFERIGP